MRYDAAQGGLVCPVLFIPSVNDMPTPSRHVRLQQDVKDTSRGHVPHGIAIVSYLEIISTVHSTVISTFKGQCDGL
jgi:hypothetical protein